MLIPKHDSTDFPLTTFARLKFVDFAEIAVVATSSSKLPVTLDATRRKESKEETDFNSRIYLCNLNDIPPEMLIRNLV